MGKWVKVYFNKDQYNEFRNGNGLPIGYTEGDLSDMRQLERDGINCDLKADPLNHMTKVDPDRLKRIDWATFGVYVQ